MNIDLLQNEDRKYLPIESLNSIETRITAFSHFTDAHYAFYISNDRLHFLNTLTGETKIVEKFSSIFVRYVRCISNGMFILVGEQTIYTIKLDEGECITQNIFSMGYRTVRGINATNDFNVIAFSAYEHLMVITNNKKFKDRDLRDEQYSMAVSKDGNYIATGSRKAIKILDSRSFKKTNLYNPENLPICISFSEDGKTLVYGGDDGNLVSISIESNEKTVFENPYFSKPIFIEWLDEKRFVVCFLSQYIGLYSIDKKEPYELITFPEFSSRYFQYASLINKNCIAIAVENLRTKQIVDSIPTCDTILLQKIPS